MATSPLLPKVAGIAGNRRWEYNLSAVLAIGGGLYESMVVPVMTKRSFMATENTIGKWWWDIMEEMCKEAAAEENSNREGIVS